MVPPNVPDLEPYLERLRALPFVKYVELRLGVSVLDQEEDAHLLLRTPTGQQHLVVEVKTVPLTKRAAQQLVTFASRTPKESWIAFSPYISQPVGQLLASNRIGFIDQAGNCHIAIGEEYLVHCEGRRPPSPFRHGRGLGARSYQVLFALLARPQLAEAPIRQVADAAGVRKTTAAELLQRLKDEGIVLQVKGGRRIARPNALLDRWLTGYFDKLRPRLLLGRYRTGTPEAMAFDKHVELTLGGHSQWAWGGAAAAYRLTHHYRGEQTVLHVMNQSSIVPRQLKLVPAKDGPVIVLGAPGPLGLDGPAPHVAHPLLVYTELLAEENERAREAAEEIRGQYLGTIG